MTSAPVNLLRPLLTYPAWAVCLALIIWAPMFPDAARRIEFYPFAIGLLLFGLPHGALDHRALPWLQNNPMSLRSQARFIAGYAAAVLLYLAAWHIAPAVALSVFLLISWLHWGQGDSAYLRLFEGRTRPPTRAGVFLLWLVRGGLPIALPVLAWPAVFAHVGAGLTRWYGGIGLPAPSTGVDHLGLALLFFLTIMYAFMAFRDAGGLTPLFKRDMGELLLLWALFVRVPPVLAVGAYFCVWHSTRHLARLMLIDPVTRDWLAEGRLGYALTRMALQTLPMTAAAIVFLLALFALQRSHGQASLDGLVYLYLSLIAALTVPHFAIVCWMDSYQRI